ncbi:MAG: hypothetical protein LBL01_00925 [Bifidobacteriaceae bacterium]|jgi:hypothetical protein|nr:hypothetical protein [Bifidobacteriaceae bacterium]
MDKAARRVGSAALLGVALALGGCMKMVSDQVIHPDNTVSLDVILAYSDAALAGTARAMGVTEEEVLIHFDAEGRAREYADRLAEGLLLEDYAQDGYTGWRITSESPIPLADLAAPAGQPAIFREGDQFRVQGDINLAAASEDIEQIRRDTTAAQMLDSMIWEVRYEFPGPVESATGEIDGNTVTFYPKLGEQTAVEVVASALDQPVSASLSGESPGAAGEDGDAGTDAGADGRAWPLWALILFAAVASGGAAAVSSASRRRRAAPKPAWTSGFAPLPGVVGAGDGQAQGAPEGADPAGETASDGLKTNPNVDPPARGAAADSP